MPITMTVRDVPDDVRDELAARARRSGRSLQEFLRAELVDLAARPDPAALVDRVRSRKAATGAHLSSERILGHRDDGRG